ncbi:nitrogen regulation protein NR(II) [Geobacter sp. SVR]|uniref:two-component system sensor histidine kinase NtrB n=1 Tax=Geobacter sp. SVR TaxID=2495594 RepID=UPI00143F01E8|nr:ATP-binding protein [Geobacter sp. SVR]BCS55126.1 hypothetical protein GSVR_34340 [Geobacter sp. SVR]GCF85307.1 hypothetical protein GSbR_19070 [Geobacter sp. SVR]
MESGRPDAYSIPTRIVAIYAIVSGVWIFFSDSLLDLLVDDPRTMARIGMVKGWVFVLVTSTLLFFLIRRTVKQLRDFNSKFQESERRFRELMEQVRMIAVMLDRQGQIVFCNDFLLQLSGWSREEIMGSNWFDTFVPEPIRNDLRTTFNQGLAAGEIVTHYENAILTRTGTERLIVWNNTVLRDGAGSVTGIAGLGIDVTDHRRLEEHLLQAQKMESIGTLAGGVAHDFNNILTVILSCVSLLRVRAGDAERSKQLIDQIEGASRRAANLTSSLLAFSRKQQIVTRSIDLNQIVITLQAFLERIIGEDVVLATELSGAGVSVMADRGQVEQVVMNMVGNARDAMPHGGVLTIRTSIVQLNGQALEDGNVVSGKYARLEITDTGEGIALKDRKRIFEPFFTTKEVGKGTGLGLSMAYGIIKQHNGWIAVESETGRGSTFQIYLPLVEQGREAEGEEREEPEQARRWRSPL